MREAEIEIGANRATEPTVVREHFTLVSPPDHDSISAQTVYAASTFPDNKH